MQNDHFMSVRTFWEELRKAYEALKNFLKGKDEIPDIHYIG